jgi:ABC-type branched-subunit amino acid transport system permease subunit
MKLDKSLVVMLGLLVAIFAASPWIPQWILFIITLAGANGLVVLGLMLFMRLGLVSFGQALFFCAGAYTTGMLSLLLKVSDIFLLMVASGFIAGLLAYLLGFLLAKYRAIFFGLLSLAFSMILYGVLVKSETLGSTDGFTVSGLTILGLVPDPTQMKIVLFGITVIVVMASLLFVNMVLKSPRGLLLTAIRDNEIRAEYMGASAKSTIHLIYVIAGVLSGFGGAIAAMVSGHIDPNMTFWTTSGEFVFIAILGGIGSVSAPFIGALIFGVIQTIAYGYSPNTWQMTIGICLIAVILVLPDGLWSLMAKMRKKSRV